MPSLTIGLPVTRDGVKAPKRQPKPRAYLTHEQVETLAAAVNDDALVIQLLAYTGLRWGELAALKVESVHLMRRRLQVDTSVAEVGGRLVWKAPKDHERRSVPFPAFLTDDLTAAIAGKGRDDLVLSSTAGSVLRVSTWRPRVFNTARDRLGADFPKVTPHDLRHTAASLVVSAGGNVLADVLDQARTKALQPITTIDDNESGAENVPGTLEQIA
jgi:integrase